MLEGSMPAVVRVVRALLILVIVVVVPETASSVLEYWSTSEYSEYSSTVNNLF
jgi:hypothetical protein